MDVPWHMRWTSLRSYEPGPIRFQDFSFYKFMLYTCLGYVHRATRRTVALSDLYRPSTSSSGGARVQLIIIIVDA